MKKIARFIIYNLLGRIDDILGNKNNLVIYCYHNISHNPWVFHVPHSAFEKQMKYLSSSGDFVTEKDIRAFLQGKKHLNKKSYAITFDDGYKGIKKALPITRKLGIFPIVFVLGKENGVDRSETVTRSELLTSKEIKELVRERWAIGSHGLSHKKLTKLPKEKMRTEVGKSKKFIEGITGKTVRSFAYPHGKYDQESVSEVMHNGYEMAFSVDDDLVSKTTNQFVIPRVGVMGDHTDSEFKYLASPSVLAFRRIVKKSFLSKYI